jgi:hypothetical protein
MISVPLHTKIYLGMSLCLSIVTIGITIVRIAGLKATGLHTVDLVWQIYWQYIEVCIGIMIVSATSFRIFYVQRAGRSSARKAAPRSNILKRYRQNILNRSANTKDDWNLPVPVPGATMTGIRTFIDGQGKTNTMTSSDSRESDDEKPLQIPDPAYSHA